MQDERKFVTHTYSIGRLKCTLKAENIDGSILDTEVTIEGGCLEWISWPEKEQFLKELNDVIDKFSI